jgi:hypothetical protein
VRDLEDGLRCILLRGPALVHRLLSRLPPAEVHKALESFRLRWEAARVANEAGRFVCHIPLPTSLFRRLVGRGPALKLEVCLRLEEALTEGTPLALLIASTHTAPDQAVRLLEGVAPGLLAELRGVLEALPEQRRQERWSFERAAEVWPLTNSTLAGEGLPASIRDVSLKGMRLHMQSPPTTEEIFIHLDSPEDGKSLDLVGWVGNVTPCADGGHHVGVQFPGPVSAARPLLSAALLP